MNKIRNKLIRINLILLLVFFILVFLELTSPAYYMWKVGILWEKVLKKPEKAIIRYKRIIEKYPENRWKEKARERINKLEGL